MQKLENIIERLEVGKKDLESDDGNFWAETDLSFDHSDLTSMIEALSTVRDMQKMFEEAKKLPAMFGKQPSFEGLEKDPLSTYEGLNPENNIEAILYRLNKAIENGSDIIEISNESAREIAKALNVPVIKSECFACGSGKV